jgi:hypothetical protein
MIFYDIFSCEDYMHQMKPILTTALVVFHTVFIFMFIYPFYFEYVILNPWGYVIIGNVWVLNVAINSLAGVRYVMNFLYASFYQALFDFSSKSFYAFFLDGWVWG